MTIIYQYRIATTSLGGFLKLLKAWKGSVYKLLYKELIIFVTLYAIISLIYRFALTGHHRRVFEGLVLELHGATSAIPLSFLLGFYVTFIVQRWWQQFTNVPWPDRTLFTMTAYLHGFDDRALMMRRSVARYMLFGLIWICRAISVAVMKRFPTLDHIVDAGFITKEEKVIFENTECKYQKFFVPLMWANQVLVTARREGKIDTDFGLRMILQPLADFRDRCSLCFVYDWITVPLVYTQVVTFAVYSYFAVSLLSQQYLDPSMNYKGFEQDFFFPGFSILQFLFYMGWLKVAEQMINPFGEDDDDFDINWLLDRHTAVAFALVDTCYGKHPDFVKDGFWNDVTPDVPYTESSARFIRPMFLGSTFNIAPPHQDGDRLLIPEHDTINQHEWSPRPRGKNSMTDSLLSLLHLRGLHRHATGDSQTSLGSSGSGHGRVMSNGRMHYMLDKEESGGGRIRRSSIDVPVTDHTSEEEDENMQLRERAHTDSDFRGRDITQRKLSLPFSIHLFKNKQRRAEPLPHVVSPVGSPKRSRFSVEPVKEETIPGIDPSSGTKLRRSNLSGVPYLNVVSRMPVLSAIEEGNTVTSIRQLLDYPQTQHRAHHDDDEENVEYGVLSDDERAYEDCISYVDEMSSNLMNEDVTALSQLSNKATDTTSTSADTSTPLFKTPVTSTSTTKTNATHSATAQVPTTTNLTEVVPAPSAQAVSSKAPRKTAAPLSETRRSLDDSQTEPLLPSSKTRKDDQITPNGQSTVNGQTKFKEELAPLIYIEEC